MLLATQSGLNLKWMFIQRGEDEINQKMILAHFDNFVWYIKNNIGNRLYRYSMVHIAWIHIYLHMYINYVFKFIYSDFISDT